MSCFNRQCLGLALSDFKAKYYRILASIGGTSERAFSTISSNGSHIPAIKILEVTTSFNFIAIIPAQNESQSVSRSMAAEENDNLNNAKL